MPNPTTLLGNPRLDQQALAHVYASALTAQIAKGALYPEDYGRRAVLAFCDLLTEEMGDE